MAAPVITPSTVSYYATTSGAGYPQANVLSNVPVRQVMSSSLVEWLNSNDTCATAAQRMLHRNIGVLPVRDPGSGLLVGIVTDRDLVTRVLAEWFDPATTTVDRVMTTGNIGMIYDDVDLMYAERIFIDRCVRRLLVLRRADNVVTGILSVDDLAARGFPVRAGEVLRATSTPAAEGVPFVKKVAPAAMVTTTAQEPAESLTAVAPKSSSYLVAEVMCSNLEYIFPTDTCRKAAIRMLQRNIGFLPVSEAGAAGKLRGVVTDRDLVVRVIAQGRNADTTLVSEVMSTDVACCFADDNLAEAQRLMMSKQVRRLLVLRRSNNDILGVISIDDIALYASRGRAGGILRWAAAAATSFPAATTAGATATRQPIQA